MKRPAHKPTKKRKMVGVWAVGLANRPGVTTGLLPRSAFRHGVIGRYLAKDQCIKLISKLTDKGGTRTV